MKRMLVVILVLFVCVGTLPELAQAAASDKAYSNASDEAIFHRVGDWFATVGKSDTEKQTIVAQRKAERAMKKAKKAAEKKAKEMKKKTDAQANKMKNAFGGK